MIDGAVEGTRGGGVRTKKLEVNKSLGHRGDYGSSMSFGALLVSIKTLSLVMSESATMIAVAFGWRIFGIKR